MSRKELLNPGIDWHIQRELHVQDIHVNGVLSLEKIIVNGVTPASGKVIKMQANGVIGFDYPDR